ncbi:MAG TPA: ABC transporter permease [Actinomycetes bacterium]|nr:ABC transporter permease [Actinomycetes bacterium]
MGSSRRKRRAPAILVALALVAGAFLVLPLAGLLWRAPWGQLAETLTDDNVVEALRVSLIASCGALIACIVLGVPLAWVLAQVPFPGRSLVRGLVLVPMVLPPVVGGVALLLAFGPRGVLGDTLEVFGVTVPFTTAATIVAATFVSLPFLVLSVEAAFVSVDAELEDVAATLGGSSWHIFRTVTLPLVRPALVSGATLAWARSLGEFGATITFAGSIAGVTQTMPLAVYEVLPTDPDAALTLSLLLLAISASVIVALRSAWLSPLLSRQAS